jgi:hypothetical protein
MKQCFTHPNKNRYNTQGEAETAILVNNEAGKPELRYYYCDTCSGYHLTSRPLNFLK